MALFFFSLKISQSNYRAHMRCGELISVKI